MASLHDSPSADRTRRGFDLCSGIYRHTRSPCQRSWKGRPFWLGTSVKSKVQVWNISLGQCSSGYKLYDSRRNPC